MKTRMSNTRALILASIAIIGGGVILCWMLLGVVESNEQDEAQRKDARSAAVEKRQLMIGMTAAEVERAWGKPKRRSTTLTAGSRSEQWVYDGGSYVYLDNGVVRAISQDR